MENRRKNAGRRFTDNVIDLRTVINGPQSEIIDLGKYLISEGESGRVIGTSIVMIRPQLKYTFGHVGVALNYPEFTVGLIEQLKRQLQ